jgi:hypothetical protein
MSVRIEQRRAQHVVPRASLGIVVHRLGEFRSGLRPGCRVIDDEFVDWNLQVEARLGDFWLVRDPARETVRQNHVIVAQARQGSGAIHEQAQL